MGSDYLADWQLFFVCFGTVFLSELGDKSQLVTLTLSSSSTSPQFVFWGSATALIFTSLIGVLLGDEVAAFLPTRLLKVGGAFLFAFLAFLTLSDRGET